MCHKRLVIILTSFINVQAFHRCSSEMLTKQLGSKNETREKRRASEQMSTNDTGQRIDMVKASTKLLAVLVFTIVRQK